MKKNVAEQKKLNKAFLLAVSSKNFEQAEKLLKQGADVNAKDVNGCTALLYISQVGTWNEVEFLLKRGADISATDNDKRTIAHYAASNKNADTFHHVAMDSSVWMGAHDRKNRVPMWYAIEAGLPQNVQTCLFYGEPQLEEFDITGTTLMTLAAQKPERFNILKMLIPYAEKSFESRDNSLNTLLHVAVEHKNEKLIDFLLENNVNVNARNFHGQTPLIIAASNGDEKTMKKLLKAGGDLQLVDNNGEGVVMYAVYGNHCHLIEFLKQAGANFNQENKDGLYPLTVAAKIGQYQMVNSLHQNGADINALNYEGLTISEKYNALTHNDLDEVLKKNRVYIYISPIKVREKELLIPIEKLNQDQVDIEHEKKQNEKNSTLSAFPRVREEESENQLVRLPNYSNE